MPVPLDKEVYVLYLHPLSNTLSISVGISVLFLMMTSEFFSTEIIIIAQVLRYDFLTNYLTLYSIFHCMTDTKQLLQLFELSIILNDRDVNSLINITHVLFHWRYEFITNK